MCALVFGGTQMVIFFLGGGSMVVHCYVWPAVDTLANREWINHNTTPGVSGQRPVGIVERVYVDMHTSASTQHT